MKNCHEFLHLIQTSAFKRIVNHVTDVLFHIQGVFMFKLSYGQDSTVSMLSSQQSVINFDYVAESPTFAAIISNTTTLNTQDVEYNTVNKTVQFPLTSSLFSEVGFGTHVIVFTLSNENQTKDVEMTVHFEESISQFEVRIKLFENSSLRLKHPNMFSCNHVSKKFPEV
jgi:hypothetical protein